jgi:hypothetical protein
MYEYRRTLLNFAGSSTWSIETGSSGNFINSLLATIYKNALSAFSDK